MDLIKLYSHPFSIYLILTLLLYFVFFQHLDSFHIRNWDESMFAVNAYEMMQNNNYIVPYYKNLPDMWNSKPPLQLWAQIFFIKLFGYNELAIRLPSALASSLSALILYLTIKKRASQILAITVFMVFITSFGVSTFHTGRTGDADAMLLLYMLCCTIFFYKWIFEDDKISSLYFFIFLTLGFLTKSVAAFLFIPAYIFCTIILKKLSIQIKNIWAFIGVLFFVSIVSLFLYYRESMQAGYISNLIENDIGRISKEVELHKAPFDFYFNNLLHRFTWFLFFIPGCFLLYRSNRKIFLFLSSLIISYFTIISLSVSKLEWYDLPLYPAFSVISGYFIYYITISFNLKLKSTLFFLLAVFILPMYFTFRNSYKSEIPTNERRYEVLSEYAFKNINSIDGTFFYTTYFDRPLYFYKYKLNTQNRNFTITENIKGFSKNDIVIVCEDSLIGLLKKNYSFTITSKYKSALRIKINYPVTSL